MTEPAPEKTVRSRTANAALSASFAYANFAVAIAAGFVLFPLNLYYIGELDLGLWIATGETIGYLSLADLGVFAVLPWLIAAKEGEQDARGAAGCLANGLAVGALMGLAFATAASLVWLDLPLHFGANTDNWAKIRQPLLILLALTALVSPLRTFHALLVGIQDMTYAGGIPVVQAVLTATMTGVLVPLGYGLNGLALATVVPQLLAGVVAMTRALFVASGLFRLITLPSLAGGWYLLGQGIGVWLGSLGVRLMAASSGLIFLALGHPEWATIYASTGKVAQIAQPMCTLVPDSGLVGLANLYGEGGAPAAKPVVLCLLMLYVIIPGFASLALLAGNGAFIHVWLRPGVFAGDYVSALLALNLLLGGITGGMFRVVGAVGLRTPVGVTTLFAGGLYVALGYWMGQQRGMPGIIEATWIAGLTVMLPVGLVLMRKIYGLSPGEIFSQYLGAWLVRSAPFFLLAGWLGVELKNEPGLAAVAVTVLCGAYLWWIRPLLGRAPWPARIRNFLIAARLIGDAT